MVAKTAKSFKVVKVVKVIKVLKPSAHAFALFLFLVITAWHVLHTP